MRSALLVAAWLLPVPAPACIRMAKRCRIIWPSAGERGRSVETCFTLPLLLAVMSASAKEPACEVSQQAAIAFRTATSKDTLTVRVHGKPCHQATLAIGISSDTGQLLYLYEAPLKQHLVTRWDDPALPSEAAELARRITEKAALEQSDSLPPWLPADEYYEEHYCTLRVSKAQYEQLQRHPQPIFRHTTHYEGWRMLIHDAGSGQARVLSECGL